MSIRRKLSFAMAAMFCMLLATTVAVQVIVNTVSRHGLTQARMRELSVFTDDVRAEVFYQMAVASGFKPMRTGENWWPDDLLRDIEVRVNHAQTDVERDGWSIVYDAVGALPALSAEQPEVVERVRVIDQRLRTLRREYDRRIADGLARTAKVVAFAQPLVVGTVLLSTLLLAVIILLIRDWFVKPILAINEATHEIGEGRLSHRVELDGKDELAALARNINSMAQKLQEHQKQLVEARELAAIGEMSTNVAHGLRNPLAGLRAGVQLARKRAADDESTKAVFDDFITEIDCMDDRITQLFAFCSAQTLNRTPTAIEQLIRDAESEARGVLQPKNMTVNIVDETDGRHWMMDHAKLAGAFGELFVNAAHHSNNATAIDVRATSPSNGQTPRGALHITVRDHGTGIPHSAVDKIFDLFYSTRAGGTGMGLPLVKRIIERHGGSMTVTSREGEGTLFDIHLELTDQPSDHEAF